MKQWRVGSITLGVILIILGVTFALGNIYDYEIIGKVIKWWPSIFILLGLEILFSTMLPTSSKRIKFDGITVFMFLIILFIGGSLALSNSIFAFNKDKISILDFHNDYRFKSSFENHKTLSVNNAKKIILDSSFANVNLQSSSNNNIEITSNITILSDDESNIKNISDSFIDSTNENNEIKINTNKFPRSNNEYMVSNLDITLSIPKGLYAEIINKHGKIYASDIKSSMKAISESSSISLKSIDGDVYCQSTHGKIEIDDVSGKADVKNQSGSINIENIGKDLKVEDSFGYIIVDKVKGNVNAKNKSAKIEISNVDGLVNAEGTNGEISLENINKNVSVKNKNARIKSKDILGDFICENQYGSINVSNVLGNIDISGSSGSIEFEDLKPRNKNLKISNENGSIKVNLAKEQSGNYCLKAEYGRIKSNNPQLSPLKNDNFEELTSTIGNNPIKIDIYNKNGSININN